MRKDTGGLIDHWLLADVPSPVIAPLLDRVGEKRYLPGEILFHEGDPADGVYLIAGGLVRVTATNENRQFLIATIGEDEVLGEMGVIDGQPRSGTATAVGICAVYFVPSEDFIDLLERSPQVCVRLLALLSRRLRKMNGLHGEMAGASKHQRRAPSDW